MNQEGHTSKDFFAGLKKIPQAESVFSFRQKSIAETKDQAVFVLDAATLMLLYKAKLESIQVVQDLYRELISLNRLYIPAQEARRFSELRSVHFKNLQDSLQQEVKVQRPVFHTSLKKLPAILQSFPEYSDLLRIEKEIQNELQNFKFRILFTDYEKKLKAILQSSSEWLMNDPVSSIYREIFSPELLVEINDIENIQEDLQKEFRFREANSIPPVKGKSGNENMSFDRLLSWLSIIQLGKEKKSNVIFVCKDPEGFWTDGHQGTNELVKQDLAHEFASKTKGRTFNVISLANMLKMFDFEPDVVKDIEKIENYGTKQSHLPVGVRFEEFDIDYIESLPNSGGVLLFADRQDQIVRIELAKKLRKKAGKIYKKRTEFPHQIKQFAYQTIENPDVAGLVYEKLKDKYLV